MTGSIFKIFIEDLDAEMRGANRHICLLIDNAPSHIFDPKTLTNVEIMHLEPNMTSHIQPMDAGIIRTFKANHGRLFLLGALERYDDGMIAKIVTNCWKHAGILDPYAINSMETPADQVDEVQAAVSQLESTLKEFVKEIVPLKHVVRVKDFLEVESEKITEAEWADGEILEQVELNRREANGEHIPELELPEPEPEPIISLHEACHVLTQLCTLLQTRMGTEAEEARMVLPKLRRSLRWEIQTSLAQTDIRGYFS
ncbi:hypothetical protein ACEPAI_5846 [Sanghuangporus weigelae]